MLTSRSGVLPPLPVCLLAAEAAAAHRFDPFTTSNGLPQNTAWSVLQARASYLWIATYDRVVRWGGIRITHVATVHSPV